MSLEKVVITVVADDRTGVVRTLSDTVFDAGANWLESSLSHLSGQFAGIVCLEVASDSKPALIDALEALASEGISVSVRQSLNPENKGIGDTVELYVEANDRAGIVEEITTALAKASINVEQMETWRESASMAGYELFIAQLAVTLPTDLDIEELEAVLEDVSDDLMVSIISE